MITVHNQDGFAFFSGRGVNQCSSIPGILYNSAHRRRLGTHDRYNACHRHNVSKSYGYEFSQVSCPPVKIFFGICIFFSCDGASQRDLYTRFCTCSLIFSSSDLISTTHPERIRSFPLEPMVLISRPISCKRKSSFLPTAPCWVNMPSN